MMTYFQQVCLATIAGMDIAGMFTRKLREWQHANTSQVLPWVLASIIGTSTRNIILCCTR